MATLLNRAQIDWQCDRSETFAVSIDLALPGWTAAELAGARWHAQARDPNDGTLKLNFDSADLNGTLLAAAPIDGAGLDASGATIPGVTVNLSFTQAASAVAQIAECVYPASIKLITAAGDKTVLATGTITVVSGPTRD